MNHPLNAIRLLARLAVIALPLSTGCGGKKADSGSSSAGGGTVADAKSQSIQDAVTGVAFDPAAAAGDTGAVRGVVTASAVRGIDLGGAEQGVRGGVRGGVRASAKRQEGGDTAIAGARVRVEGTSLETVTNEKGEFKVPFVPPGNYVLVGEKQGASGEVYAFGQSVAVSPGGESDLGTVSLEETGAIRGNVKRADATSQLGIDVFIPGSNFVAKTDDDGNFNIIYIPKGTYKLAAMFPGFEPFRWKDIAVESKKTTDVGSVELKRAAQDKATAASIFGRVTASGGGGVRDVTVSTVPDTRRVQTDSAGNFIISNIAPGVYLVSASRPGFSENSAFVDITESLFDQVEIRLAPSAQVLASADQDVKAGAAPTVSIDGPNSVTPGSTVAFKAGVSDADSNTLYLKWKSSGGSFDATWSSEVNWTAPSSKGVFIIEVTVTDGVLSDRASTAVSVAPEGQTVVLDTTPPFPPRPDKLAVKMNPPGTEDTIEGKAGCVEAGATIKFYSDGLLVNLLASTKAGADGSFATVKVGDNKGDQNDQVFIAVFDAVGNLSPVYFVVNDKTPPDTVITATPCSAGQTTCLSANNSGTFEFSTAEAGATFQCKMDKGDFASCTSPHTFSGLSNGSHLAVIQAKDAAGNIDPFPASFTWSVDASAPVVGTLTLTNASTATHVDGSFDLSASVTEAGSNLVSCETCVSSDGTCDLEWKPAVLTGLPPNYTCTATAQTCTDGQALTVQLRATDAAQTLAQGAAVTRKCDTTAPTTSSNAPTAWVNADQTIALSKSDAGSGVSGGLSKTFYCVDNSDLCTPDIDGTSVTVTCTAGTVCQKYVRAFSRDAVGNQENTISVLIKIDKQAPTSAFSSPADGAMVTAVGPTVNLSGTASDGSGSGVAKAEYSSNGGTSYLTATGTTSWSASFTATKISHNVRARATDAAGNVETASAGITVWMNELVENNGAGHLDSSGNMVYTRINANDADGTGLNLSAGFGNQMAVDTTNNRLFVADSGNHRILVFNLTAGNALVNSAAGRTADFVLGQPDVYTFSSGMTQSKMNTPQGLAFGGNKLYVSDNANRVLVFDVTSITNGENAVNVLGQANFTLGASATTQSGMASPKGLALDTANNRLFVADSSNRRVLVFNVAAITDGENAVNVLGKANFTTNTCETTQSGMCGPESVAYDSNLLYVGSSFNKRVLVFDVNVIGDGETAVNLVGQSDWTTNTSGTSSTALSTVTGVAIGNSKLFVAEGPNRRVTVFNLAIACAPAVSCPETADNVLGQSLFTTSTSAITQSGMTYPEGLAIASNLLWVSDSSNRRIMQFDVTAIGDGEIASDLLGHFDPSGPIYTADGVNNPRETGLNFPGDIVLDLTNNRAFVSDSGNNRILVFNLNATSKDLADRSADFVLGQLNFNQTAAGSTQTTLSGPQGLEYDATNIRLYAADRSNRRVLVFDVASITNGEAAAFVLGQPDFTTVTNGTTQSKMYLPEDVVLSPNGSTLYVVEGDSAGGNNRVITFNVGDGITNGEAAVNVLGQADFNSSTSQCSRGRFSNPARITLNGAGSKLFVSDYGNSRITVFDVSSIMDGEEPVSVLGQGSYGSCASGLTASQMNSPKGLAYDTNRNWLYVAEVSNNRVTLFDVSSVTDGEAAKTVIGQSDLISGSAKGDTRGLSGPSGAAFDAGRDRLWIVDQNNHRLLNYNIP